MYGFLAGVVMFGAIIFLPVYLQAVQGMSPTLSGLAFLPAMVGIFATSIPAGQLISKTGRYKVYPVIGAGLLTLSLLGLSRLAADTPYWQAAIPIFLLGAGLGLTMQTILTAIQNSVDYGDIGTATGATTFFRQIGGAIGVALFGSIFANRVRVELASRLPAGAKIPKTINPAGIRDAVRPTRLFADAFAAALHPVFLMAAGVSVIAFALTWLLREVPLRTKAKPGEAIPPPGGELEAA